MVWRFPSGRASYPPMIGNGYTYRNKAVALLAVAGMFFQAFLVTFHVPAIASGTEGTLSIRSETVVICTGDGFLRITVDENGEPEEQHNQSGRSSGKCPVCLHFSDKTSTGLPDLPVLQPVRFRTLLKPANPGSFHSCIPAVRKGRDPPVI